MMLLCVIHQHLITLYGFLEIKSPYSQRNVYQQRLVSHQGSAAAPQYNWGKSSICLCKERSYFSQVQGQTTIGQ